MNEVNTIVKEAVDALNEKKAIDIKVIDISNISIMADCFIIASGNNVNQIQAMCDNVREKLSIINNSPKHIEGYDSANWILLDYSDVIIHLFDKESRSFYDLERIWSDGREITSF
ncbi:MAG: ribosome silencing factor [Lachnospiraceae bacterium]|nr:ribosome silencing factor [Lachnospiraceae bacterium]